jgi:hypothetical protein
MSSGDCASESGSAICCAAPGLILKPMSGISAIEGACRVSAKLRQSGFVFCRSERHSGWVAFRGWRGQPWRQRVLPWALARDSGSQGPLDLLTRLAYRREDSSARTAAGIRGRASPLRSNVARCARSLRSRLRVSTRGRTVAPEPRPFASRGSPQSLGARRARIATADSRRAAVPAFEAVGLSLRSDGGSRKRAERRHTGYVFVWSSEGWLGIERPLEGRLSTALSPRGRASAASDEQGRDDDHYQQRKTPQEQPRGAIRPPLAVPQPDAVMPQLSSRHRPVRELRLPPKFQPLADLCNQSTGHRATLRPMPRFANRGFAALP